MTHEGDKVGEQPTSYGLQPPNAQNAEGQPHGPAAADNGAVPAGAPAQPAPAGAQPPHPRPQAAAQAQPAHQAPQPPAGFQPTEVVADPMADRLLGGRYRLTARLGHGGMGTVWRAHDEVVGRDVAVKEPRLPDNLSERQRQTAYERMQREARAAARIDHPSVVTVHDVVVEDGKPWIVMELVRGRSLGDQLSEGTLDPREVARIGVAVLGALAAAHEAGILHRDVKPDNVLLGRYGRVVLTDFGIAQIEGEQGLTETGAFVGSPEFIAPERVLGQRPGPESDLWSLGVVLYAAVEGMSPYRRQTTPATLQAVLSAEPAPPARGSGALGMVVMQLLRKDPAARPTAAEVRQQLESVARPAAASAMATPLPGGGAAGGVSRLTAVLPERRGPRLGVLGGALAVALALVLLLADPFGSDGAPEGWKTYDESERVRATLAAPRDYKRSVDENSVTYTDPGGVYTIWISRGTGWEDSALSEANNSLSCDKGDDIGCTEVSSDVDGTVEEYDYQGREAAQMDETWTKDEGYETEEKLRSREFFYVNQDNVGWHLTVAMPAMGKAREDGEQIFQDVLKHLEIQDL